MTSCLREPSISSFRGVPRHSPPSQWIWLTASATPLAKTNAIDIEANNRTIEPRSVTRAGAPGAELLSV